MLLAEVTLVGMIGMAIVVTVVYNGMFLLFFGRTPEFRYLYGIVRKKLS